jgi:hypothetical protein
MFHMIFISLDPTNGYPKLISKCHDDCKQLNEICIFKDNQHVKKNP